MKDTFHIIFMMIRLKQYSYILTLLFSGAILAHAHPQSEVLDAKPGNRKLARGEVAKWQEKPGGIPLVENPPRPGQILKRETIPNTDIVVLMLSNGAKIIYKKTDFAKESIKFTAISPGGLSLVSDDNYISAVYATLAISKAGYGQLSRRDLEKFLMEHDTEILADINEIYEYLEGRTTREELETLFQLIALHHTSFRRDKKAWDMLMKRERSMIEEQSQYSEYSDEFMVRVFNNHYRMQPDTIERLSQASLDKALSVYRDRFRNAGDFTYIFVGDFDPEKLEILAERWLAGLPSMGAEKWEDRNIRNMSGQEQFSMTIGMAPTSMVMQFWLGNWDVTLKEYDIIEALIHLLETEISEVFQKEYGITDSVSIQFYCFQYAPIEQYQIILQFNCDSEMADELSDRVLDIIETWKENPPEDRYVEVARKFIQNNYELNSTSNRWWEQQILFALLSGISAQELIEQSKFFNTLTPQILQEATSRYFNNNNRLIGIVHTDME